MTDFLQRSALILLATTALCATPALARTAHHAAKTPAPVAEADADTATYKVRSGDTLQKISGKLGTSIDALAAANKLTATSILKPGQVLKNPAAPKAAAIKPAASKTPASKIGPGKSAKPAPATTYAVAKGDTLFSISKRLGVSVDDLRQANGLSAKGQIHAGQDLKLPGGDEEAADKTPPKADKAEPATKKGRKGKAAAAANLPGEPAAPAAAPGHVVTSQAKGATYKARKGDTLAKIADRVGTDVGALKRLNHVKGSAVQVGKVYSGPSFAEHAYTAVAGDTLTSIAQRFGVSVASLRAENEMSKKVVSVRPGQKVFLPEGYRDPSEERPARNYPQPYQPSRGDAGMPSGPRPYVPPAGSQVPQVPAPTPNLSDAQISQLGKGRFQWPLTGAILSDFGPKPGGQRNDGINIQADAGASVRASADGEVIYAGDQVPGFGNLVLVKHPDGWATVYAHLGHIDVKNQQKVTQGQQVGTAGSTGGVSEPQLHFEVRYAGPQEPHARSVDPKLVLPK